MESIINTLDNTIRNLNDKELAKQNVEFLLRYNVDIIVIACGTISSNCLSNILSIPNFFDIFSMVIFISFLVY